MITPSTVLMVKPWTFGYDAESASSNAFQKESKHPEADRLKAIAEYEAAIEKIAAAGIEVISYEEKSPAPLPDAVFPNNWIGLHPGGRVIIYPMAHSSRQLEKEQEVIPALIDAGHRPVESIDLSEYEQEERYFEGTGSMVIDYRNKKAYACISPRTDLNLFRQVCELLELEDISFRSTDLNGQEIYHTNVMMAITEKLAIVCMESIENLLERKMLEQNFIKDKLELIDLNQQQINHFCGNVFEAKSKNGDSYLICSQQAWDHFTEAQQAIISRHHKPLPIDIETIERIGGGSARCMVAGVYF